MKVEIKGVNEFTQKLYKLEGKTQAITKQALYPGAKIAADAIKAQIQALPTIDNRRNVIAYMAGGEARLSNEQKEGLLSGFGLSKMKYKNGETYIVAGFQGYNNVITKKWPKGQPNLMIAAVVEKGTSFFPATPFYKRAINQVKPTVIAAIQQEIDRAVAEIEKRG